MYNYVRAIVTDYLISYYVPELIYLLQLLFFLVLTFMRGTYSYIPETNHVSRVSSVAAVLYLQFMLHVMSFHP
jgi:succinate dehydrogenase hydrophobic anchor subunit